MPGSQHASPSSSAPGSPSSSVGVRHSLQERAATLATTLCLLADQEPRRLLGRGIQIQLIHEQVAALAGTSRETTTKILNEYADQGLVLLGRGRITITDLAGLAAEAGE